MLDTATKQDNCAEVVEGWPPNQQQQTKPFILEYVEPFTRNGWSSKNFIIPVVFEWDFEVQHSDSAQDIWQAWGQT